MKENGFESFNRDFYVKLDRYSVWEKADLDCILKFLDDDSPLPAESKDQLPQFIFNVEGGLRDNTLHYPIEFIVAEIDLPKPIKEKAKNDVALAKYWEKQFKTLFRKFQGSDIPYWMMYVTSSGYGIRFVIQSNQLINNEDTYKLICKQFLDQLKLYGIDDAYHDLRTINKGWYFPTNKNLFDLRGDVFNPDINEPIKDVAQDSADTTSIKKSTPLHGIEYAISQIEQQKIDITADYHEWVLIGYSLAHRFKDDGRNYYHRISQFHPKYDNTQCDKQYDACLKSKGGGITLGTFFHIARSYGVILPNESCASDDRFWYFDYKVLKIDYDAYFKMLFTNGIGRLNTTHNDDVIFIKVDRNEKIVRQITKPNITEFTIQYIQNLNIEESLKKHIINSFLGDSKILMPKNYAAINKIEIDFIKDNAENIYFFYRNCFVRITQSKISIHDYEEMQGYIWESQILPREFSLIPLKDVKEKSEFFSFVKDVSRDMNHNENRKRFLSLKTIIGYLLHAYKDPTVPKSIVFMDANLSKELKGRTGKGIVKTALSYMRKLVSEDGKRFDFRSQFSFSQVTMDTDILFIDDVPKRFDFEKLFSVLTEGVVVEKKHKDKFFMDYEDSPKILITTNYAIQGSGDSFDGRIYEYEFCDFYKYGHSPMDKFGHRLFDDWDQEQWKLFDSFMIRCCNTYLRFGLKESEFINLHLKKIIVNTGFPFIDFLSSNIVPNKKYEKQTIFEEFLKENPDYKDWNRNRFTTYMKDYFKLKKMDVKETHSGRTHYFRVIPINNDLS